MFGNQFFSSTSSDDEYNKLLDDVFGADYTAFYRGTVVDNDDPLHFGRVRVRVPQIYGSSEQRDTKLYTPNIAIPWATSAIMAGAGNNTGAYLIPNVGDTVLVTFENGDPQLPLYFGGLLTADGENKFIGTKDANNDEYYKVTSEDFNTDITNKSQRVLYKSLKGATIIIDDKDGSESIKIIDQLGQFISLENFSGEALNRDRSGGVDTRARSGRIVIKDAYEDSIALNNGEIHIKAPKITIETDDLVRVGLDNQFPDEVDLADEILGGEEEEPIVDEYVWIFNNDTDKPVAYGLNYRFTNDDVFEELNEFDFYKLVLPGESYTYTQTDISSVNSEYYILSCINSDYYGNYNIRNSWQGTTSQTLNASACLADGKYYVRFQVDMTQLTDSEREEVSNSGTLQVVNNYTGETRNTTVSGIVGDSLTFSFGYSFLIRPDDGVWEVNSFHPYTRVNIEETRYLPLPVGDYNFIFSSSSGDLDHTLGTLVTGPTQYGNNWEFYRFPFATKGSYYSEIFTDVSPLSTITLSDVSCRMIKDDNGNVTLRIENNSDVKIACLHYSVLDAEYEGSKLSPRSKQYFGTYIEWSEIEPGEYEDRSIDLSLYPEFNVDEIKDILFGYFKISG